jgi:hypothetical protein
MKIKFPRLLLLAGALALLAGCENTMSTADIIGVQESYPYYGPNSGFYDSWYGGGAYVGAGGYGGVGIGISIPVGGGD